MTDVDGWKSVISPILHERADPPQPRSPHKDASFLTTAAHLADAVLSELDLQPTALHLKALSTNFRWILRTANCSIPRDSCD